MENVFSPETCPQDFDVRGGGLLARRPGNFQATSADLQAVAQDLKDMISRYGTLPMPVSVLFGRGDTILDPEVHGRLLLEALPSARLDIVEGGHMLPVTVPQATAEWIAQAARQIV